MLTTTDELKIAYLSGRESSGKSTDFTFNVNDIDELAEVCSSSRVDILMTSGFPCNVNEFSFGGKSTYLKNQSEHGSMLVAKLAKSVLPRYHFAPSENEFFEREPYRNHQVMQEQPKLVTRFISVAAVGNELKQKWLYAFNIVGARWLTRDEVNRQPDDATENPYVDLVFDLVPNDNNQSEVNSNGQFFFQPAPQSNRNQRQPRASPSNETTSSGQIKRPTPPNESTEEEKRLKIGENSCWFCLSGPQVEKHLIISIGDKAYLG